MAISLHGQVHNPPGDNDNAPDGPTVSFTPPADMVTGDFVLVSLVYRGAVTWTNSNAGGQTWSSSANTQSGTTNTGRLFWCVYDGTWDADPVFTVTTGTAGCSGWMAVFRGVDQATPWDVTPVIAAQASSTTFVIADYSTNTDNAWAIVGASSQDNNTWTVNNSFVNPSGSGNVYWRSAAGTDNSLVMCRRAMGSAGAVGATTMTQATLGDDLGTKWYGALKAGALAATQTLTEGANLTATALKAVGIILLEALTLTDPAVTAQKVFSQELTETVNIEYFEGEEQFPTTKIIKETSRAIAETAPLIDAVQRDTSRALTETATLSDVLTALGPRTGGDWLVPGWGNVKESTNRQWILPGYGQVQEGIGEAGEAPASQTLTDSATLSDTLERTVAYQRELTESATLSDSVLRDTARTLSDGLSLSDVLTSVHAATLTLTESALLTDAHQQDIGRTFAETASLTDVLEHTAALNRTLTESASLSDTVLRGDGRTLSEATSLTESLLYSAGWAYPDTLTLTVGAIVSGVLTDVWNDDGNFLVLSELQAPTNPAFVYDWDFGRDEAVPTPKLTVTFKGWYDGNAGHNVTIWQWRYVGDTWVQLGSGSGFLIPDATSEQTYRYNLYNHSDFVLNGHIRLRISHESPGQNTHQLHVDELFLSRLQDPSDLIALSDTVTKEAGKTLAETVGLTDSLTVQIQVTKTLTETLSLADTVQKDTGRALIEAAVLSDVLSNAVALQRTYTEAITLGDTVTTDHTSAGAYTKTLTETAGLTDVWSKQSEAARTLTETAVLTDGVEFGKAASPVETASLSDSLTIIATLYHINAETVTLSDTVETGAARTLTEVLTLTDPTVVTDHQEGGGTPWTKELTETAVLSDSVTKDTSRTLSESLSLSDALTFGPSTFERTFTESANLADTIRKDTARTWSEEAGLSGTTTNGAGKYPSEIITLSDVFVRGVAEFNRTYTETVVLADTLTTQYSASTAYTKDLTELLSLTDTVQKDTGRTITDLLNASDVAQRNAARSISESLTLSDIISKGRGVTLLESQVFLDTVTTFQDKHLLETLVLTDTISQRDITRTLEDVATLSDEIITGEGIGYSQTLTEIVTLTDTPVMGTPVQRGRQTTFMFVG